MLTVMSLYIPVFGGSECALAPRLIFFLPLFMNADHQQKKKKREFHMFLQLKKSTFHYKFSDYASSYLLHIQIYV